MRFAAYYSTKKNRRTPHPNHVRILTQMQGERTGEKYMVPGPRALHPDHLVPLAASEGQSPLHVVLAKTTYALRG